MDGRERKTGDKRAEAEKIEKEEWRRDYVWREDRNSRIYGEKATKEKGNRTQEKIERDMRRHPQQEKVQEEQEYERGR